MHHTQLLWDRCAQDPRRFHQHVGRPHQVWVMVVVLSNASQRMLYASLGDRVVQHTDFSVSV